MQRKLEGQIAIVTGATAGIGKEIALMFVKNGASVIAVGTNLERGQLVEKEASTIEPGMLSFIQVDISNKSGVETLIQATIAKFGKVDILVNNAGITKDGLLLRMSEDDWNRVLSVNLTSCFYASQAVIKPMLKARKGKIINITSVVGIIGNAGQCNYAASKAGMIGFSKSLAREVASRGILVNCIAPGFIETSMTEGLHEKKDELAKAIPLGRFGKAEEIALAALFLASADANYITGQVITVDGGLVM